MLNRLTTGVLLLTSAVFIAGCGGGSDSSTGNDATSAAPEQPAEPEMTETDPPEQPRETLPAQTASSSEEADKPGQSLTEQAESTGPLKSDATLTAGPVTLLLLPWEEIEQHIANNLNGKVVVLDLWATYCLPCRESFPGLVALSKQDPENIVCVSVSLDDPDDEEKRTEALQFLEEQQATFTNILCTTDADTLYDEILKIGGIPAVYVYDRDGGLAKLFNGPTPEGADHTYEEHITPYVTELAASE